jgi:hypothetical protein
MRSSTSSSEPALQVEQWYDRPLPERDLGRVVLLALGILVVGLVAWEMYWRAFGSVPSYRNSDGQWAIERRRIDHGEGGKTVIAGSSRMLFNIQLPVWERLAGERPIQLALEGTSPIPLMEDLAADPDFTGRLLVGVAPDLFFSGFAYRASAFELYRKETLSQRAGQWLSMTLLEPWLAFYDEDFALPKILKRQPWPQRNGVPAFEDVRKLALSDRDRSTHMWHKVESDSAYVAMARRIWAQEFDMPPPGGPEAALKTRREQITRAVKATHALQARGVEVIFVRPPSAERYLEFENRVFPRAETWDVLLAESGAPGIHFEDHPELQGYRLPEWSHMSAAEAERFTAALQPIVERVSAERRKGD